MKSRIMIAAMGTLLLGSVLSAQVYRDSYGRPMGPDAGRGYGRYDRGYSDPVDRSVEDIRQARAYGYMARHEAKELEKAENELWKFQDRWRRGHFDRHHLDEAIEHLQRFVNSARIDPRQRERLDRDLYALRDFRSSNGGYPGYDRRY